MIRRTSQVAAAIALGLGVLAGPLATSSAAAPCPPGWEWDRIAGKCILIHNDPPDPIGAGR